MIIFVLFLIVLTKASYVCQVDSFEYLTDYPPCPGWTGVKKVIPFGVLQLLDGNKAIPAVEFDYVEVTDTNATDGRYFCESTFATDFDCQRNCIDHVISDLTCNGDANYCANNTCTPPGDCNCSSVFVNEVLYVLLDSTIMSATSYTEITLGFTFGFTEPASAVRNSIVLDTQGVEFEMDEDNHLLRIIQPVDWISYLRVQKDDYSAVVQIFNATSYFEIPTSVYDKSGWIYVSLIHNDGIVEQKKFWIPRHYYCEHVDCENWLCTNVASEWKCANAGARTMFVIAMVLIFFLFCAAVLSCTPCMLAGQIVPMSIWIGDKMFRIFWFCVKIPRSAAAQSCFGWFSEKANKTYIALSETKNGGDLPTVAVPESRTSNSLNILERLTKQGTFALMFGLVTGCQDGLFIQSQSVNCVDFPNSTQTCYLALDFVASVPYPGAKYCASFGLKENLLSYFPVEQLKTERTQQVYGNIEVTYLAAEATTLDALEYYTSSWEGVSESRHRCYQQGHCEHGDCEKVHPQNATAYGELSGLGTMLPGLSTCERSCGCATCGCISCTESCIFARGAIKPTGPIYRVSRPTGIQLKPVMNVKFLQHGEVFLEQNISLVGPIFVEDEFKIQIIGTLTGNPVDIKGSKIITVGNDAYLQEAASSGHPSLGAIGDIQSTTALKLQFPSANAFAFAPEMITYHKSDKSIRYNYYSPGINSLQSANKLPGLLNGDYWTYSGGALKSNLTNPGALLFKFQTLNNISWTTEIKPCTLTRESGDVAVIEGCYNCPSGAYIKFRAKNAGDTVTVGVWFEETESDDYDNITLSSHSVTLSENYSDIYVWFKSPIKDVSINIEIGQIVGGSNSINIQASGELSEYVPPVGNTTFQFNTTTIDHSRTPLFSRSHFKNPVGWINKMINAIDKAFLGGAGWLDKLIASVVIIGAFIVLSVLGIIVFKLLLSRGQQGVEMFRYRFRSDPNKEKYA